MEVMFFCLWLVNLHIVFDLKISAVTVQIQMTMIY